MSVTFTLLVQAENEMSKLFCFGFFSKVHSKKVRQDAKAQEESKLRQSSKSVSYVAQHFNGKVFVRWSDSESKLSQSFPSLSTFLAILKC